MTLEEKKVELFKLMDELMAKGVGINLAAQVAASMVLYKDEKVTED